MANASIVEEQVDGGSKPPGKILLKRGLEDYIAFYETMSRRSLPLLDNVVEQGVTFKDPFNEVYGYDKMMKIFQHMFDHTEKPKFKILDYAWTKDGMAAFIKWNFSYERKGEKFYITGMSEVLFSNNAKVMAHTDYWDSGEQFYEHIPLLGKVLRWVKKKMKV